MGDVSCHDESPGHEGAHHDYVTDEAVILHDIRSLLRAILAELQKVKPLTLSVPALSEDEHAVPPADEKELADYIAWVRCEYGVPEGEIVVYGMGGHPVAWSRRASPSLRS